MTEQEKQEKIAELRGEIGALTNLLEQGDYKSRKLIAELCRIVREKFPDAEMPIYEKYFAGEQQAQNFRNEINRLEQEIKDLER